MQKARVRESGPPRARKGPGGPLAEEKTMERAIEQRRSALMGRFSAEEWGLYFNMTGRAKAAFFLVDEKALKKGQDYLLYRPAEGEAMMLFDLSALKCYSSFLLCPAGMEGLVKSRLALAGAGREGELRSLLKDGAVLASTDYPYEAVYHARELADGTACVLLGIDGGPEPRAVKAENCLYVRIDLSSIGRGETAEKHVENALRGALAGL